MNKQPKVCNICNAPVEYVDSSVVYWRSYGMIYQCTECDARVSVHKGTNEAMGILANEELRELKKKCHLLFDRQWKNGNKKRRQAYKELSELLDIDISDCHIWYFDKKVCKHIIKLFSK